MQHRQAVMASNSNTNTKAVRKLLNNNHIFVVAEIGKNFIQTESEKPVSEYLKNAKRLVDAAKDSGCDAVKFQTHEVEDEVLNVDFVSPHFKSKDRYSWVTRNTLATPLEEFWKPLKAYCDAQGIIFFSSPMSRKAAQKLSAVGVPFWKIGSSDIFDYVMLDYIIHTKKPVIFSTGIASRKEVGGVVEFLSSKKIPIVLLYCVSKYPAPKEYFNLATMEYFQEKYPHITIGFSDHSLVHDVSLAAIKLGARVVEKHFSFSRDFYGADHKTSITPNEMKELVSLIRSGAYRDADVRMYYGAKNKKLESVGNQFRPYFHKSLVAGDDLKRGTIIKKEMLFAMRPRMRIKGLPSHAFYECLEKKLKRSLKKYEPITKKCFTV